jgi:hypothetical protein
MSLYRLKDEEVADRIPFLSVGNLTLELDTMGRGEKRGGAKFSYVTFRVVESDTATHGVDTLVTKWIQDASFSCQKDLKNVVGALIGSLASELDIKDVVPLFYPEGWNADKGEPERGTPGAGAALLKGKRVKVQGYFPKKKDGTMGTYPNHDFFAAQKAA